MYRIVDITSNGVTRTDGKYPQRIACLVEIYYMQVGHRMVLEYIKDANGNEKSGYLLTSEVLKIAQDEEADRYIVTTENSEYTLTKTDCVEAR